MSQNTQFVARAKGAALEAAPCPVPTDISPTEVVIRIKCIAVNPADSKMIDLGRRGMAYPLVAGLDGAGVVEAVGSGVTRSFRVGDEVVALFEPGTTARGGSYQEFAVVDENRVAKKGDGLSFQEAASLGVCYFTAVMGLALGLGTSLPFVQGGSRGHDGSEPASVLVLGGSSALGAATIQLLRLVVPDGKVLATASPKHMGHITGYLGADAVFDRNSESLVAEVRAASHDKQGVDAIFDAVGAGASQKHVFEALDPHGLRRYAQVWTGDDEIQVPPGVESVLFRSRDYAKVQGAENIMAGLQTLLADGRYKVPLPVRNVGSGLDGLKHALDLMREGVSGEKLVVTL